MTTILVIALPASAQVVADYQFMNNLQSAVPGAPDLVPLGAGGFVPTVVDGAPVTGWAFPVQTGLDLDVTGLVGSDVYSVVMLFEAQEVYDYAKLLDTQDRVIDEGLYFEDHDLEFYDEDNGVTDLIVAGNYYQVVVTRDGAGNYVGYVDGVEQLSFSDSSDYGVISPADRMVFFRDDFDTSDGENTAGTVVRIRLYDNALTPSEVATLDRTSPEQRGSAAGIPALEGTGILVFVMLLAGVAVALLIRRH